MAVSQMRRVQVLSHSSHRASLIKDLQDLEIIHINNLNEQEEAAGDVPSGSEVRDIIRGMENDSSRLQSTIEYLASFEPKKGFIAGMLGGGPVISSQEYADIIKEVAHGEWRGVCEECQSLQNQLTNSVNRENRLRSDRENLRLWGNLDVPIEEIHDTEETAIRIGVIPLSTYDNLLADLESSEVDMAFEKVGETKTEAQVVLIFLKADEQAATAILTRYGFSPVSLPLDSGTVTDRLKGIDDEMSGISAEREEIEKNASQLASHRSKLMAIYDHLSELLNQERTRESFLATEHTFMVDGWVRQKDVKKLEDELSSKYEEIEINVSEPTEDDEPPVDLEIRGPADPFQMATRLYGIPQYREIDPTPLIAPFFAFFFGICITDAGYGFVVALVAFFAARKISGGGKNLLKLLFIAGLATIVVGAMTGGWFGIEINPELLFKADLKLQGALDNESIPEAVPQDHNEKALRRSVAAKAQRDLNNGIISEGLREDFKNNKLPLSSNASITVSKPDRKWWIADGDSKYIVTKEGKEANQLEVYKPRLLSFLTKVRVLDPQGTGQMTFLVAVLVIGFIQVWFGFFVKLYIDFKDGDLQAVLYDDLPWVLVMILMPVAGFIFYSTGATGFAFLLVVGAILICCLITILFSGRESDGIAARLGTGGFELYTRITGTFGDVLSYLRLFALGLATGIIGGVINTMAGMMWGSLVGKIAAVGILIGGHTFNLVINALGGFIHTARLQFVEFFTKFYEGGGEEFRPFKREHTYVTVVDLENPQESK